MKTRFILIFGLGVGVIFLFSMAVRFPVYPDEITLIKIVGSIWHEGLSYKSHILPCDNQPIPSYLLYLLSPQLWTLSLISGIKNIYLLRSIPLLIFLFYLVNIINIFKYEIKILIILICCSTIMLFPSAIWLITLRPEFLIYLFLGFVLIYINNESKINKLYKSLFLIFILFLLSLISIAHPKYLYLIILYFALLYFSKIPNLIKGLLLALSLIYFILVKDIDYQIWLKCENFKNLESWLGSFNINPLLIFSDFKKFVADFFSSIVLHLSKTFFNNAKIIGFSSSPIAGYIPVLVNSPSIYLFNFILSFLYLINFLTSLFFFFYLIKNRPISKFFFTLSVYIFIFIQIAFNRTENSYDLIFWFAITITLNMRTYFECGYANQKAVNFILAIIFPLLCVASALFYFNYFNIFTGELANGDAAGPNTPQWYYQSSAIYDINADFNKYCYDNNDLLIVDDRTFIPLSGEKKTITQISYLALPYYLSSTDNNRAREGLLKYIIGYSNPIFYGSCGLRGYFSEGKIIYKNDRYNLCCVRIIP